MDDFNSSMSGMASAERKHYNRALREMYHLLKMDTKRLELSERSDVCYAEEEEDDSSNVFMRRSKRRKQPEEVNRDSYSGSLELFPSEQDFVSRDSPVPSRHRRRKPHYHSSSDVQEREPTEPTVFKEVYGELASISAKLQREHELLLKRECALEEKAKILEARDEQGQDDLSESLREAEQEFVRRLKSVEQEHQAKLGDLEMLLQERTKENKRLKDSFETLKNVNDSLRKQLDTVSSENKKLETRTTSVQNRLANLQRKQEIVDRHKVRDDLTVKAKMEQAEKWKGQKQSKGAKQAKPSTPVYETLGVLLEWISEVHLQESLQDSGNQESSQEVALKQERCLKILPSLVDILHDLPSRCIKLQLPCLQFIYWSLMHLHHFKSSQTVSLTSTFRRLGEELYKPSAVRFNLFNGAEDEGVQFDKEKRNNSLFFRSSSLHVRFLSSLVILKTLTQVDHLAQVFDVLRSDLKEDRSRELFMRYKSTTVILPYLKSSNKTLVNAAVDVYLQMTMESVHMNQFLESCCHDAWFGACAVLLRSPNAETKLLEKMSILLQKLSKLKATKKLFDVCGLSSVILEMSRTGVGQENAFLSLNLRSIVFNLNLVKISPT